jgi:hypothetical protein
MNFFFFFSFQSGLCRFYFFSYWAGWKFCFVVFFFKTLWILTMFPHIIFVLLQCFPTYCFLKLSLSIFFNIELVENLALTFPTCFFFPFFWFFFQNCLLFFFHFLFFFSELFLLILFF